MRTALIVVDVQRDFCEGGSLEVLGGAAVADLIRYHIASDRAMGDPAEEKYAIIAFTQDWHSPDGDNGGHFGQFPPHCIADTEGAQFHPNLQAPTWSDWDRGWLFRKGNGEPAFSGFQGRNVQGRDLDDVLRSFKVEHVDVVGIATDYCVKATALDAHEKGYDTAVWLSLTAAVGGLEAMRETAQQLQEKGILILP